VIRARIFLDRARQADTRDVRADALGFRRRELAVEIGVQCSVIHVRLLTCLSRLVGLH